MTKNDLLNVLERGPVIAAVNDASWDRALNSSAEVIFYLKANLMTVEDKINQAINKGKTIFIHIDLAEGIGKDRAGVLFLAKCGVHGVISTRSQLINFAKEEKLLTVQRFFALDSQGLNSLQWASDNADFIEIMPGVIPKVIKRFSKEGFSVIAGGLIETKEEVMTAIKAGTLAVSTGKTELWEL